MDKSVMKKSRKLKLGKLKLALLLSTFSSQLCLAQTHTMPGSNVVPSGASLTIQSGGSITAAAGSTVTGFGAGGGGNVSNSGTPTAGQKATWVDATHIQGVTDNALQWDGGATNLVAATARTSLALVPGTNVEVPLTFSTGLTRSTNTVTVNTSQNIATLSNLTTNGFVKTGGAVGTLSVDTATYQAADADLTTWAGLTPSANFQTMVPHTFAQMRTDLGLGTAALNNTGDFQAADADLTTWAGITPAANVGTFLATSNSANLRAAVTDENGTGALLFNGATSPDFTTGITIGGQAVAAVYSNASAAGLTSCCAANTIIPGSTITIPPGAWKASGVYHCVFDMTKTGGTGSIVLTVHMGTLGTTSDATVCSITLPAGTAVADSGVFHIYVIFKTVGSGTSAVVSETVTINKNLTTTGLSNTAFVNSSTGATSVGFNSTTQTKMSVGFTGGASFGGTNTFCQAEYNQ